jgi:hypothetical protein
VLMKQNGAGAPADAVGSFSRATVQQQAAGLNALRALASLAEPAQAAQPTKPAKRQLAIFLPLLAVLTVQATLSLRLTHANTAFEDEALYLWAGHLQWAHWLHGLRIPLFPTYFSGAPVIYPPLGALADSIGGLAGARILSLVFMLGATVLLWSMTKRFYGRRAAFFAAGLWAVIGPTQRLGAFATYDAMALFLVALAAWCVTGGKGRRDAIRWILAGACALALANATKYASALFDPVVAGLAFLSGFPPGGKAAQRRVAYFLAVMVTAIITMLQIGRGWYIAGIEQTTLTRHAGGTPASVVLRSSWDWTAIIIVLAAVAVVISFKTEKAPSARWLLGLLAGTALLVPIEQARIHTYTSLSKHVDFGAWFAVIAAAYAADRAVGWLKDRTARRTATAACGVLLFPAAVAGASQATDFFAWPGAGNLIPLVRQVTTHGGRFLADNDPTLEYYFPHTSWQQWSSVYGITLPSGQREAELSNDFAPFKAMLAAHYFTVVILTFSDKPQLDGAIAAYLTADKSYRFVGTVPFSNPGSTGSYLVWVYRGAT